MVKASVTTADKPGVDSAAAHKTLNFGATPPPPKAGALHGTVVNIRKGHLVSLLLVAICAGNVLTTPLLIMLNTDLHSTGVSGTGASARRQRKKMTKSEFLNNLRGVESSEDLSRDYLSAIYDSIEFHAIEIYVTPNARGTLSIRSGSTEKSRYSSSFAASRAVEAGDEGPNEDLTTMIKAIIGNVKPAQELLRGVAVHRHPFLTIADYDYGRTDVTNNLIIPRELVCTAVGVTWHHFHLIINNTLDTAHLDSKGLESCLDVLKYALCATICLDMPTERAMAPPS
mgnify:CR=1 FL=1